MPTRVDVRLEPFAHATAMSIVPPALADAALSWMEYEAPWTLRIASFYEQWELHLGQDVLPSKLSFLLSPEFIAHLVETLLEPMVEGGVDLIEVTAHKLQAGQTIRLHNDYLEDGETHRILIQLNRGWTDAQGGLLMLFGSDRAADVKRVIRPVHGTAFGFSISPQSFHAVSTITNGERFTLVYSFKTAASVK